MDLTQLNTLLAEADAENPSGVWEGAPSLAASTVAMTNDSGHVVVAGISGGTVTVVAVNGITLTGVTSGRIRLRRGDTLAITYSGAPTMQWLYE